MNAATVIALAAVLISMLTFVATQVGQRRAGSESYVESMERRAEKCEEDIERLKQRMKVLEDENLNLLRKLMQKGGE